MSKDTLRVLIVEPEPDAAERLGATLHRLGHDVVGIAHNAQEALQLMSSLKPDVALLEADLPDRQGFGLIEELKVRHMAPVIVVARQTTQERIAAAAAAGADSYLPHAPKDDVLIRVLTVVWARHQEAMNFIREAQRRHELELRFRFIFDEAPIGMALVDLQGHFVEVNLSLARMLGYTPNELKGMTFGALTHPDDQAISQEYFQALLSGSMTTASFEKRYVRKDGRPIWVALSTSAMRDAEGRAQYFITMMQNITARKEAEALIRLQSAALEAVANGVVITDRDGTILWANPALAKMTGYSLTEVRGQNPRLFKSGYQDRAFYERLWDTILSGQTWHGELINRRKDGSLYSEELTITPLLDANGVPEYFIAVKQDITARKQAEQERERAFELEQHLRRRAEALVRASAALTTTLDLDGLLRQILEAAIAAIPAAEKGSVLLPADPAGQTLYVHTAVGYEQVNLRLLTFERGYAVEAFRQKMTMIVPNVPETYRVFPDIPEVGGLQSALAVPLKIKQRVLGVLCLDNASRTNAFTAEDAMLLESFAAQAAIALDNARMFAQVQRERETLHILYALSRRLAEVHSLRDVVAVVLESGAHVEAAGCELALMDREPVIYTCWEGEVTTRSADEATIQALSTQGIEGWALEHRQAALVEDTQTDARWHERPHLPTADIRSVLCLPLWQRDGRPRGWISYFHPQPHHFTGQHLALFNEIGERIGSVLETLRLSELQSHYLEQQRQLTSLAFLLNRETELSALERAFLPVITGLTHSDAGSVAVYDAQQKAFVQPYHYQLPEELHWETWPVDKGVTGRLARTGRGEMVNDYASQPEALDEWKRASLRAGISVPLLFEGELVGLLECYRFQNPRPYGEEDLDLVTYAGELLAVALQRARLYSAEREQRVWASALLEATTALSQHLELDRVLDIIMEQAERVVAGDAFNIMLLDENDANRARVLRRRDRQGLRVVRDEVLNVPDFPLLQEMVNTHTPVLVQDTAQDPRWRGSTEHVRAFLSAPILSEHRVIGFLNVHSVNPQRFSLKDAQRLQGFAVQVAIALDNARLYRQLLHHADVLEERVAERTAALDRRLKQQRLEAEVARDVNASLTLHDMLQRTVDLIVERLEMYHATLFLVDPQRPQRLRRVASAGHAAQQILALDPELTITQGLVGTAVRAGAPVRSPDVHRDPRHRYNPYLPETRSEIALPLRTHEGIIGVLDVQSQKVNAFDDEDALSLQILADQIALSYQRLKNAAQAQEQYARLQAVLQSTSDGILVASGDGTIQSYNAAVEHWLSAFTLSEREAFYNLIRDLTYHAEEHPQAEVRLGNFDLQFKATPIQNHGEEVVISIHDITELKTLDRMKTEFVSNVSHELRTPVTTILLYTALLKKAQGEEFKEYLEAIASEAQRQAHLVEDILAISRFDAGRVEMKLRPTSLNMLAQVAVATHRALAFTAQLALDFIPATEDVRVMADAEKMTQVLNNLVENALRYTHPGGRVTVSVGTAERERRLWGTVSVADTGFGIPPDELPHIFERFYRGSQPQKQQIQGTGLGLAIVKELVKLHQGHITVESTVGVGSTFTVYLPLIESNPTSEP